MDIKSPVGEARNEYVYRSDGSKLRVIHRWNPNFSVAPVIGSGITESALTSTETTDYVGNYVYVNNTLKRILTENGYIENQAYSFYVEDHLESARITADASGLRKQTIGYYPYGMQYGDAISTEVQPYKYTAKEYDQMHGLNLYDSKARFYDPALARFTSMDPLAEKYYAWSPYAYGLNNPLRFTDPTGMFSEDEDKNTLWGRFFGNLGRIFSLEIDGSTKENLSKSIAIQEQKTEAIKNAVETVNTVNDVLSVIVPFSSIAEVAANADAGNYGAAMAAVPFAMLDIATVGKGKGIAKNRALWKLTKDHSEIIRNHKNFGSLYKSLSDELWWSIDNAGHGGSAFKVFKESNKGLEWYKDADKYGDFINNKHKGPKGIFIPWGNLKNIK